MQNSKYFFNSATVDNLVRLTKELTALDGISSDETAVAKHLKKKLEKICNKVEIDKSGNVTGFISANNPQAKTLSLEAHMDKIGLMVTEICDDGSLKFVSVGGVDERILPSVEVCVRGTENISGIVFVPERNADKNPKIKDMRIDIGMSKNEAQTQIKAGDMVVINSTFTTLCGGRFSAAAMDNRAGVAAILDALSKIDRNKLKYNLEILFSVQEELGLHGAYAGAKRLKSDAAIVVDVTHGTTHDTKDEAGVFPLGSGAIICRGPNFDYNYTHKLIDIAKSENVPYMIEAASGPSGTNAWAMQISGRGIPSMLISIPLRYMHTNVETLDIKDVDAVSSLIASAAEGGALLD